MINFSEWYPHIVIEKWKLLAYFTAVPDDSTAEEVHRQPGADGGNQECFEPGRDGSLAQNLVAEVQGFIPQVQEQLEIVTKEVAQGRRRMDLDMHLLATDQELRKAEEVLDPV